MVSPSQSVVNKDAKKLETGDLLNFRAREMDVKGWWIDSGSWGTNEHALGPISIQLLLIFGRPATGKVKTRLKLGAAVVADKKDFSVVSKEDSTVRRENTRQVINKKRKQSGTKN